jgi:hypothetical protein
MIPTTVAHVLRIDNAIEEAARPLSDAIIIVAGEPKRYLVRRGSVVSLSTTVHGSVYDNVAITGSCPLCSGKRICPDCGGPCEICTITPGGKSDAR